MKKTRPTQQAEGGPVKGSYASLCLWLFFHIDVGCLVHINVLDLTTVPQRLPSTGMKLNQMRRNPPPCTVL